MDVIHRENPGATIHLSTWGTPFSGWGEDQWTLPDSDGTWAKITSRGASPGEPTHIWNGKPERARRAIDYMIRRLEHFPADTMVAINLGFDPDGGATMGGDAKPLAREVAKVRPITTWDYSLAEGELVAYPHWRLPRMAARRREERAAAPYRGAMSYTMSPKLNLLTLWAAGRIMQNPDADPDKLSREFCAAAFGAEHAELGELFEAFEVVPGWGHYPRRRWSKSVLRGKYREMIDRLEAADPGRCGLPLFPPIETYRDDLLWFARRFEEMAGPDPDREAIKKAYWARALTIYDHIPMSADARAEAAAKSFSSTLGRDGTWGGSWG